jgi:glycosyltransferase involved in cell wall biosynthesis
VEQEQGELNGNDGDLTTDVCLIVEGAYPYVRGGVSSWIDWLIRSQPELSFSVVAIVSGSEPRQLHYKFRDNVKHFSELVLGESVLPSPWAAWARGDVSNSALADAMVALTRAGGFKELERIIGIVNDGPRGLSRSQLMDSRLTWTVVCQMYETIMPHASFLHFYWAWRALFGGLFAVLKFPLPMARTYHTVSTGYAGLVAARAAFETGRPALLTEHGIYTNERRIEILMADWIADTVDKGIALDDARIDLRDIWINVFDAYARACYDACSAITTLYQENQNLQFALGAARRKLSVIANGIEIAQFKALPQASQDVQPTVALIGRVVPIKDVKTFIAAAAIVRARIPNLRALVVGPTDESPSYYQECLELVRELGLGECVRFTGSVKVTDLLPSVHVVALTSLSEAQPLVLLEAGAAGIPCVATNVGACREIIDGRPDEGPALGLGGVVCELAAPEKVAEGIWQLLEDKGKRRQFGEALRQRVCRYYDSAQAQRAYQQLYQKAIAMPTLGWSVELA